MACIPVIVIAAAVPLCVCGNWVVRRCMLHGSLASADWPHASYEEFKDINRVCRILLAVYEDDITHPEYADRLVPSQVVKRVSYADTGGNCPPYLIYVDHEAKDMALVIRGLNLGSKDDFQLLANKGHQMFDGGYVHHGLLQAAGWLLEQEFETLKDLLVRHPEYHLTLGGHSLGSGIAALVTIILVNSCRELSPVSVDRIRCYAIAPSRTTSMNLAVRYADCIKSVVLQDDFLPRTSLPLHIIFGAIFCLPCLLSYSCAKDTFTSEAKKLCNPERLYVPGRCYHVVYTKVFSFKKFPPIVRTAIPVDGRFENIVCSLNSTEDHSLVNIEKKTAEAAEILQREDAALQIPEEQRMERAESRRESQAEEHTAALYSALSWGVQNVPDPFPQGLESRGRASSSGGRRVAPSRQASYEEWATRQGSVGEGSSPQWSGVEYEVPKERARRSTAAVPEIEEREAEEDEAVEEAEGEAVQGAEEEWNEELRARRQRALEFRTAGDQLVREAKEAAKEEARRESAYSKWDTLIEALVGGKKKNKRAFSWKLSLGRKEKEKEKENEKEEVKGWDRIRCLVKERKVQALGNGEVQMREGEDNKREEGKEKDGRADSGAVEVDADRVDGREHQNSVR